MVRDSLVKVCGKLLSNWTIILVLRTGETEDGLIDKPFWIPPIMVTVIELVTVYPLIMMVIVRVCPLLTDSSKAEVRQIRDEVEDD